VSDDRLLRYDNVLPGHMIPPLKSVRTEALNDPSAYSTKHQDWIRSFYDWSVLINHPAMNMGSVQDHKFRRSDIAPPWAWEVFGTPGIVDTMLQNIVNGKDLDQAWQGAVKQMQQVVQAWKSTHLQWKPTRCS
jgi:hypothetical protein